MFITTWYNFQLVKHKYWCIKYESPKPDLSRKKCIQRGTIIDLLIPKICPWFTSLKIWIKKHGLYLLIRYCFDSRPILFIGFFENAHICPNLSENECRVVSYVDFSSSDRFDRCWTTSVHTCVAQKLISCDTLRF